MTAGVLRAAGEASLSAAVMILAVLALRVKFQDRTPRRAFCLLWDMVLARLLVPGALPSPVSIRRWLPDTGWLPGTGSQPELVTTVIKPGAVVQEAWQTAYMTGDTLRFVTAGAARTPAAVNWGAVLAAVWLGVALLLAAGFLWSHLRSRRVYAASLPCRDVFVLDWLAERPLRRPVQARTSDRIAAPLTYGVLYPVILLPRGMDWEDREALACVLSHEYEHIRRFDALRKVFLAAALCLHWFNPLVWAMYALANRDIELNCDEAVLRGGADRERYALALLGMEERRGRWSPSGSHFSGHALEERIKAIMKRKHISVTALIAVLVVMSVTTTVFASAAPEGSTEQDPRQNAPEATTWVYGHLGLVEDNGVAILSKGGEDGEKLYSVDDGETWMSEERYHAEYGSWGDGWQVEWWTYEDYKVWLEEEKAALQSIIGERGWTSSTGWFTWDQKMVDETVAMYEKILEEIRNGALYSRTIIGKDGNEVEDVALGSDGNLFISTYEASETDVTVLTQDMDGYTAVEPKAVDKAALLEELKAFGIGGNANLMTYNGELIRTFVDGVSVGDSGYSIRFVYTNSEGTIDLHTLRSVAYNPDGSYDPMGELIGLAVKGDKNFDQKLIDCATFSAGPQATAAAGNSAGEQGRTFEEIFARYAAYGLVYTSGEGMGTMTWNGRTVKSFADLAPDGSAFSWQDPKAEDGLRVQTVYGQDGNLTGLRVE